MANFALDTTNKLMQFAMPAEKVIPTPHTQPSTPAERKEITHPKITKEQPKEIVDKPTQIVTGKDYLKLFAAFSFLIICVFFLISARNEFTSANQSLQDIQNQTTEVNGQKSNLSQEVHELSNYDRVMQIAEKQGLEMNEENIRNVEK